jgi:hypothetical protein
MYLLNTLKILNYIGNEDISELLKVESELKEQKIEKLYLDMEKEKYKIRYTFGKG